MPSAEPDIDVVSFEMMGLDETHFFFPDFLGEDAIRAAEKMIATTIRMVAAAPQARAIEPSVPKERFKNR